MVPANDIPELNVGMKVALAIDGFGERRFTGTIDRINPTTEAGHARHPGIRPCAEPRRRRCAAACS